MEPIKFSCRKKYYKNKEGKYRIFKDIKTPIFYKSKCMGCGFIYTRPNPSIKIKIKCLKYNVDLVLDKERIIRNKQCIKDWGF